MRFKYLYPSLIILAVLASVLLYSYLRSNRTYSSIVENHMDRNYLFQMIYYVCREIWIRAILMAKESLCSSMGKNVLYVT